MVLLDPKDLEVLTKLRGAADRPQKSISSDLGMSEPALSKRIKQLREGGVIKNYTVNIDYSKLGFLFSAITFVKWHRQDEASKATQIITAIPEAIQVYKVIGQWDLAVIWLSKTTEEVDLALSKIASIENTAHVETTFFIATIKRDDGGLIDKAL